MPRIDPRKLSASKVCVKDAELLKKLRGREPAGAVGGEEERRFKEIQVGESFEKKKGVSGVKCCKEVKRKTNHSS